MKEGCEVRRARFRRSPLGKRCFGLFAMTAIAQEIHFRYHNVFGPLS